jgi:hypothetical protein
VFKAPLDERDNHSHDHAQSTHRRAYYSQILVATSSSRRGGSHAETSPRQTLLAHSSSPRGSVVVVHRPTAMPHATSEHFHQRSLSKASRSLICVHRSPSMQPPSM